MGEFELREEHLDSLHLFHLREIISNTSNNLPLHITIKIPLEGNSYRLECYEVRDGKKDREELSRLHNIKVEGFWDFETLKGDLLKIVNREFKTFKPRYYPF